MTTLIVQVDDERADSLKRILHELPYVKNVAQDNGQQVAEPQTQYQKIKAILDQYKDQELFKDIEDPSAWQREIRKEWDRDF